MSKLLGALRSLGLRQYVIEFYVVSQHDVVR